MSYSADADRPTPFEAVPIILQIAREVGCRFPRWVAEELDFECLGVIDRLPRYNPTKGKFRAWCRRVLWHLAIDIWRRRTFLPLNHVPAMPVCEESEYPGRALRDLLDELAVATARMEVDPYAILLLHIRLTAARRIAPLLARPDRPETPPSVFLSDHLEWRSSDLCRTLGRGLPTLAEAWARLVPAVDRPPHRLTTAQFVRLLASPRCSRGNWTQWCHRSCNWACRRIGRELWNEHFGPMLGDRD